MKWWIRLCAVSAISAADPGAQWRRSGSCPIVRFVSFPTLRPAAPPMRSCASWRHSGSGLGSADRVGDGPGPGTSGSLAARAASAAPADSYTLFFAVASAFVTVKGNANIPIDVPRDFMPISIIGRQPMFITIAPQTGIKSLQELIEAAERSPGGDRLRGLGPRAPKTT